MTTACEGVGCKSGKDATFDDGGAHVFCADCYATWRCAGCNKRSKLVDLKKIQTAFGPVKVCPFCASEDVFVANGPGWETTPEEYLAREQAHRQKMVDDCYPE